MFSPENNFLFSASWDKKVCLSDWANSTIVATYNGHTNSVMIAN